MQQIRCDEGGPHGQMIAPPASESEELGIGLDVEGAAVEDEPETAAGAPGTVIQ